MRMRRKKHYDDRLNACSHLLCECPDEPISSPECHFGFDGDMYLEIGCGKGGFAVQFAAANPSVCFYAMERVGNVMVNAVERAEREKDTRPDNLRFMIANAQDLENGLPPILFLPFILISPILGLKRATQSAVSLAAPF